MVLLVLVSCREERSFLLSDWLEARVKSPISGIISVAQSVTVISRGETVVDAQEVYYLSFGESIALRDDGHWRVIIVDHDGNRVDLPCPGGASLAPDRFPGIDCWAGGTSDDFAVTRYAANGRVLAKWGAPDTVKQCGRVRMGYSGYDPRGEPVVGYECMVDGVRLCRATTLGDAPVPMGEIPASTPSVDCGYLVRTQGRPLGGVKSWSRVGS
jgi:hypothetical protein